MARFISLRWTAIFTRCRPDGSELWRLHTGGWGESSPVLDESGNLYLPADGSDLSIGSDGKKRWGWGKKNEISPDVTWPT